MSRGLIAVAVAGTVLLVGGSFVVRQRYSAWNVPAGIHTFVSSGEQIRAAINGLDLARAKTLLYGYSGGHEDTVALRARLALYEGDCDESRAILGPTANLQSNVARDLSSAAEGCARAMSAARSINDEKHSVWIRLQDDADAAWTSLIVDTAAKARQSVAATLGVRSNLLLRIELVMDHASLSALTGLPLEAAETTGTVAVARFGRVTLLSPRAFPKGYPWQDTLAHEITHLLVTVATNDNAPLWLQEGLAKHLESSWRSTRPHDGIPDQHEIAHEAWVHGQSVGFERLGASIALLPNPEAANIAYAEVFDFLDFLVRECGWNGVKLVLRELRTLGSEGSDAALRSATGYSLGDWTRRWRDRLSRDPPRTSPSFAMRQWDTSEDEHEDVARRVRLAQLYSALAFHDAVEGTLPERLLHQYPIVDLRSLVGLSLLAQGSASDALRVLGDAAELTSVQGEWLALRGRALLETAQPAAAREHFGWALAYAPTDELVACQGFPRSGDKRGAELDNPLCLAARKQAASASEPLIR